MPIEFESELVQPIEAGDLWISLTGEWIQVVWVDDDAVAIIPGIILSHDEFHDLVCTCTYVGQTDSPEDAGCYGLREDYEVGVA